MLSSASYDDLSAVFERLVTYSCPAVMCGDFNVRIDQTDDANAVRLDQLLQSFGYVQHVSGPTHNDGHIFDPVVARSDVVANELLCQRNDF